MKKILGFLLLFILALSTSIVMAAEQAQSAQNGPAPAAAAGNAQGTPPNTPAEKNTRTVTVRVDQQGNDSIGMKLSLQLKEYFQTSSLFNLSVKDGEKIKILVSTNPEFTDRPNIGSAYSIVWLFSEKEGSFDLFLVCETGVVSPDEIPALVSKIAERTDGLSARYNYLYKNVKP